MPLFRATLRPWNSFVLITIPNTSFLGFVWKTYYQIEQLVQWFNSILKDLVSIKSFALLHNSNWNWFINATSSHEMLHTNCLNLDAYIAASVILEKMTTICLLICILHLNLQMWHWILHEYMFQCHSKMKIDIPTKVQTMLE